MKKIDKVIKELQEICMKEGCIYINLNNPNLVYSLESLIEDDYNREKIENLALSYYYEKFKKEIEIEELKEKHYDIYYNALYDYIFDIGASHALGEGIYHIEELSELMEDEPALYLEDAETIIENYHKHE